MHNTWISISVALSCLFVRGGEGRLIGGFGIKSSTAVSP